MCIGRGDDDRDEEHSGICPMCGCCASNIRTEGAYFSHRFLFSILHLCLLLCRGPTGTCCLFPFVATSCHLHSTCSGYLLSASWIYLVRFQPFGFDLLQSVASVCFWSFWLLACFVLFCFVLTLILRAFSKLMISHDVHVTDCFLWPAETNEMDVDDDEWTDDATLGERATMMMMAIGEEERPMGLFKFLHMRRFDG